MQQQESKIIQKWISQKDGGTVKGADGIALRKGALINSRTPMKGGCSRKLPILNLMALSSSQSGSHLVQSLDQITIEPGGNRLLLVPVAEVLPLKALDGHGFVF